MKAIFKTVLWSVVLSISVSAHAAAAGTDTVSLSRKDQIIQFEHITVDQGLSNNAVTGIVQDNQGFMWFSTFAGLNRYDGHDFKVFLHDSKDPSSLSDNPIRILYKNRSGGIWVGTWSGGLNRFVRETATFVRFRHDPNNPHSLSHDGIRSIHEDQSGTLWIGTNGGGLNRLDRETNLFKHYQHDPKDPQSLGHNVVYGIYEDRKGVLWIGTEGGGLNRFNPESETFTRYRHDPENPHSLSHNKVRTILEDRMGRFWVSTIGGGLNQFDRETGSFKRYQHNPDDKKSISNNNIIYLYEDRLGLIWIGTIGGGLNVFDPEKETFDRYLNISDDPESLNANTVYGIVEDGSGLLWVGTEGGGINRFDREKKKFKHYKHNRANLMSLGYNDIFNLDEDSAGKIWISYNGGGIDLLDRKSKTIKHFRHDPNNPNSLSNNTVYFTLEDRAGRIWIGTFGGGLNRYHQETGTFTHYRHDPKGPESLSDDLIITLHEGRNGNLWIGTWTGGLNHLDIKTGVFRHYKHDPANQNSLSSNSIASIHEDRSGVLWVGTVDNGLNRFDRQTGWFKRYRHDPAATNSLSHNGVLTIHEDRIGNIWLGTWGGGLNKFDPEKEKFTAYTKKNGLPSDAIYGILEDDSFPDGSGGNLWLSTDNGLSKFNPQTETFRNYNVSDGLQGNQFNPFAYGKTRDGEMLFGGINGFNSFYPEQIKDNLHIPPVVITSFQLANKPVPISEDSVLRQAITETHHLTIPYAEQIFSFEFAALNYRSPEKNRYKYKLEGFDTDWHETTSSRRFATYTHMDPGKYTYKVIGSNNDRLWNEEGTSIRITITPPWWATIWFRGVMLILVTGLILGGYRWRISSVENQKRTLEIQVDERTHELGERIKELNCLFGISKLVDTPEVSLNDLLQGVVNQIPPSWQYPDIACSRIVFDGQEIKTENFNETGWKQSVNITVFSEPWGTIEVCYLEDRPNIDEGPFSKEERNLINAIGENVSIIIERKQAEKQLKTSIKEKETLLQEIHHRVKNNMTVISSMLSLQARRTEDQTTKSILQDSQNRIQAMSMIHETLYSSENLSSINMNSYFSKLVRTIFQSFGDINRRVVHEIGADNIHIDVNKATPLGLIVNELLTNTLKYAFPGDKIGKIRINLESDSNRTYILTIADNGIGLAEDIEWRQSDRLGLKLVILMVENQLKGTIDMESEQGTKFTIKFRTDHH